MIGASDVSSYRASSHDFELPPASGIAGGTSWLSSWIKAAPTRGPGIARQRTTSDIATATFQFPRRAPHPSIIAARSAAVAAHVATSAVPQSSPPKWPGTEAISLRQATIDHEGIRTGPSWSTMKPHFEMRLATGTPSNAITVSHRIVVHNGCQAPAENVKGCE